MNVQKMEFAFTIIIPHKDIPDLLRRCLDSIPERDDLHVIIVDDDSDPSKVDFTCFPGLDRPDCEVVFTKEGKGAGYARNIALELADSRWILFADADDYYSDDLNTFLDRYKNSDADLVFYENVTVDNRTGDCLEKHLFVKNARLESTVYNDYGPLRYRTDPPWTKMVRTGLIRKYHVRFQEIIAGNDTWFSAQVGHFAKSMTVSDLRIYVRTIREGSLAHSFEAENFLARMEAAYKVNAFLIKTSKPDYSYPTLDYLLKLRRISQRLFIRNIIPYLYHTPNKCILKDIRRFVEWHFRKLTRCIFPDG